MIIMSHLSDAQMCVGIENLKQANININFAKFLILKYADMETEINADEEWEEFMTKHSNLV